MPEKIAIVTLCRKGSERFPNKACSTFFGMPLYMHTVNFAVNFLKNYPYYFAHDYDSLYLPKDVHVIKREEKYAGAQHKTCEEVKSFNIGADIFILLQVTSPVRNIKQIYCGIDLFLKNKKYLCGFTAKPIINKYVYDVSRNRINFSAYERTDNGCKREMLFVETGAFYIFRKSQLNKGHILHAGQTETMIVSDEYGIDIDTPEDLQRIERIVT